MRGPQYKDKNEFTFFLLRDIFMQLCIQVGVAYIKLAVSEGTDFSIAGSIDPEAADLLRTKGSRTVTKFTLITLTTMNEDKKQSLAMSSQEPMNRLRVGAFMGSWSTKRRFINN